MARTNDLIAEELDGGMVIYDRRDAQAHYLDPNATAVWRACRQPGTETEIVSAAGLEATSGEMVLSNLIDLGLVKAESGSGYSRRTVLRTAAKVGLGSAVAAPILSAVVPMAAAAASSRTTQPLTPGFWKNHQTATTPLLPQPLGIYYTVHTFLQATAVFANMNFGGNNAFNGLAGHLLAAELNVANGAGAPCALTAISEANALLTSIHYTGPSGVYSPTAAQRAKAVTIAGLLNNFNNGSQTC